MRISLKSSKQNIIRYRSVKLSCASTDYLQHTTKTICNNIETPALVSRTFVGHPPYFTPDMVTSSQQPTIGQLDLQDLVNMDIIDQPFSNLYSQQYSIRKLLSIRDINEVSKGASDDGIVVQTKAKRVKLSVEEFLKRIELDQPEMIIAFADEVGFENSRNRIRTASKRTLNWFYKMRSVSMGDKMLFGMVLHSPHYLPNMEEMTKILLDKGADGIVLGGCYMGESREERISVVNKLKSLLPTNVPLLLQGANEIQQIVEALKLGADLISSDVPMQLIKKGHALANLSEGKGDSMIMDLWDKKYEKDTKPIVEGCECLSCKSHSRAYIHHLLLSHELLAEILLYQHNEYQLRDLFKTARDKIDKNQFDEWIVDVEKLSIK